MKIKLHKLFGFQRWQKHVIFTLGKYFVIFETFNEACYCLTLLVCPSFCLSACWVGRCACVSERLETGKNVCVRERERKRERELLWSYLPVSYLQKPPPWVSTAEKAREAVLLVLSFLKITRKKHQRNTQT